MLILITVSQITFQSKKLIVCYSQSSVCSFFDLSQICHYPDSPGRPFHSRKSGAYDFALGVDRKTMGDRLKNNPQLITEILQPVVTG